MIKVVHVITGLNVGGAEMMLYKLISGDIPPERYMVVCLSKKGRMGDEIEALGIKVFYVGMHRLQPIKMSIIDLILEIRKFAPDVIQGWMYHANVMVFFLSLFRPNVKIIFGIRQSLYDIKYEKYLTRIVFKLNSILARKADYVIFNSYVSISQHIKHGFQKRNLLYIPNGFDLNKFHPKTYADRSALVREKIGIPSESIVIGMISRFHPMKGHDIFVQAMSEVFKTHQNVRALMVGTGVVDQLPRLMDVNKNRDLFYLLDLEDKVPEIMSIVDISVNSSKWGEGFSNSICESMAMEIPCVVTDIGDSGRIVGDAGVVVKPNDPSALTEGLVKLIAMSSSERNVLGVSGRRIIETQYSIKRVREMFEKLYS